MLVILSPAKTLDFSPPHAGAPPATAPLGSKEADYLAGELRQLSQAKLKALLSVSDSLAKLNHERFQAWGSQERKPCLLAYMGDAYRSLRAAELSPADLAHAQATVRVLSGLYGVLRPLDAIQPYRLEMGSRLANRAGKDLYAFWREKVTAWLRQDLEAAPEGQRFLVNCASQEYAKALDTQGLGFPVYQMSFPGPSVFCKGARGAMVRYIVSSRLRSPEQLKRFTGNDGEWAFQPGQSSETEFVFARSAPSKAARKQAAKAAPGGTQGTGPEAEAGGGEQASKKRRRA